MMRSLRRRGVAALAGMLVLALAGCATPTDASWRPLTWPADPAALVAPPQPLDPATVAGLVGQRIRNDAVGVQARWSRIAGDHAFDARIAGLVKDAVASRAAAARTVYRPTVFPPGTGMSDRGCVRGSTLAQAADVLANPAWGPAGGAGTAVVCDVVAASGPFLGERIRVVTGTATAVATDTTTVLYADLTTGEVATADQLWTEAAPAGLWHDVVEVLRRQAGALSLAPVHAPDAAGVAAMRAALATTIPAPDGSLVLTLPTGFTAPELAEIGLPPAERPETVGIPPAASMPLLTPFAARFVAATGQSQPAVAPAAVPPGREAIDCALLPCVAMTYDDGPSEFTTAILDAAASHRASVTFFSMGEKAGRYADVIKRAVAEGNLVENHTWNHPHLPRLSAGQVTAQIRDTTAAIAAASGVAPTVFRPPYGDYNAAVLKAVGMAAILWDVDTFDWQGPADDVLVGRAVGGPSPGSIVLQHDIQAGTGRTVGAVYDGLIDRGFTLVNVRQLFGGTLPTSGAYRTGR